MHIPPKEGSHKALRTKNKANQHTSPIQECIPTMLIVVLANKFVRFTSGRKCLLIPNQFNKSPPTFCLCKSMNKIWEAFHCSLRFFAKKQSQTNAIKFLLVLIFFESRFHRKMSKKSLFLRHRILPLTFGCAIFFLVRR